MAMRKLFLYAVIGVLIPSSAEPGSWPQFRGPNGAGIAVGNDPLPADLEAAEHLLWKTSLAPGRSSPVVANGRVYVTGIRDGDKPVTICLDATSGDVLWERLAPDSESGSLAYGGGRAQCTCTANDDFVISFFGTAGLLCYDRAGEFVWQKKFDPFNTQFGVASSPILFGDRVILNQDFDTDSFLMAVRLSDGSTIWEVDRPDFIANFATPMIWEDRGQRQIIVPGSLMVIGYDFETGEQIWSVSGISWSVISTPILGDGILYVNATAPGEEEGAIPLPPFDESIKYSDQDNNGSFSRDEFENLGPRAGFFPTFDRNKDGEVVSEEYEYIHNLWNDSRDALLAIRPGGRGEVTDTHVLWSTTRSLPNAPSPLYHNGHLFMVKNGGIVSSLDAKTGEQVKQARISGRGDYYSSPVLGDGKIYFASERGDLSVIRAEPKWKEIAHAKLDEEIYGTPAIVDGRIYVRTTENLFCFGYEDLQKARDLQASATDSFARWPLVLLAFSVCALITAWFSRPLFQRSLRKPEDREIPNEERKNEG